MKSLCFYFQVHQPFRLRSYRFFDMGVNHNYYDDYQNKFILRRVAERSYLPMNKLLMELIKNYGSAFKVSFSITGLALEQLRWYAPDVLKSFHDLAKTGHVEFLAETYSHSLASLRNRREFISQINKHSALVQEIFGVKPTTFRNTELIYSDDIADMVYDLGYTTILTEGAKHVLGWKSPNFLYHSAHNPKMNVLLRNYQLSDDIAFRFSEKGWSEYPLTAEKFSQWVNAMDENHEVLNLFMDYETFGEHQREDSGIFAFFKALVERILGDTEYVFRTPSEISTLHKPVAPVHVPHPISWADEERDLTAWLGNELQDEAFEKLYSVQELMMHCTDEQLLYDWNLLQSSDHFYYMCTKWFSDGMVHSYFNPYGSAYEAFINYMNIVSDFLIRVDQYQMLKSIPETENEKNTPDHKNLTYENNSSFDRLFHLSAGEVKRVLNDVDSHVIAAALKGLGRSKKEYVLRKLSIKKRNEIVNANPPSGYDEVKKARIFIAALVH
ncbi:MAG: polysaccharide deacetylase family protein [Bacteroidales bacterium]|nr:polysaccharide deacetylase family protein [Bacteroidales bacterium]